MKRFGDIWGTFISKENTYLAWELTIKGRRKRKDVIRFNKKLDENLEKLRQDIISGIFVLPPYFTRKISEKGKWRTLYISPLRVRIYHHMIINVIEEIFNKGFISDTYGCIKGRGQIKGSLKVRKYITYNKWCLQTDIRHFYPTIDHEILFKEIKKKIKDKRLLNEIKKVVFSIKGGKNCPIGNLTSQLFGNIYLNKLDKFIKHTLKVKCYCRYCDDSVIFSNDLNSLKEIQKKIKEFVKKELKQELSYSEIYPCKHGVDFLGYRHFKGYTILRKSTALSFKRRIKRLKTSNLDFATKISVIMSIKGHCKHCYTYNYIRSLKLDNLIKDLTIKEFREVGAKPEMPLTGKKVSILTLMDKDIIITAWKLCKVDGEESLKIQCYLKGNEEILIFFTRSIIIRQQIETVKKEDFPFCGKIKKEGKAFYLE